MFSVKWHKKILQTGSDHLCPELEKKKVLISPLGSLWSDDLNSSLVNTLSSPNNLDIIMYKNLTLLLPVFGKCQNISWVFFGPARRFLKSLLSEDLLLIDSLWNWSSANCRKSLCLKSVKQKQKLNSMSQSCPL